MCVVVVGVCMLVWSLFVLLVLWVCKGVCSWVYPFASFFCVICCASVCLICVSCGGVRSGSVCASFSMSFGLGFLLWWVCWWISVYCCIIFWMLVSSVVFSVGVVLLLAYLGVVVLLCIWCIGGLGVIVVFGFCIF